MATSPSEPGTSSQNAGRNVTAAGHRGWNTSSNRSNGSMTAAAIPLATGPAVTVWTSATTP